MPATEWPLFGSVFYLCATEHLQDAWEEDPSQSTTAPADYARRAIEACVDLFLDPVYHTWLRMHWGADYMHNENVFFRSLIIPVFPSHTRLTQSTQSLALLKDQANTLAKDLDASPYGVLYDYPGECYPIDVFAAVTWIHRAGEALETDYADFIARERRAFQGSRLDHNGLVPWTGEQLQPSRGIVNAHVLIFAPHLYPDLTGHWYERYVKHFWQQTWCAFGFREFYRDSPYGNWTYDIDSGPILGGFSPATSAFSVAAAHTNGQLDHAFTPTAQIFTASLPLPNGRLLGARVLSDREHAHYLGETPILWQLYTTPCDGVALVTAGSLAGFVYIGLAVGGPGHSRAACGPVAAGGIDASRIRRTKRTEAVVRSASILRRFSYGRRNSLETETRSTACQLTILTGAPAHASTAQPQSLSDQGAYGTFEGGKQLRYL